jgi:hypothetical protein
MTKTPLAPNPKPPSAAAGFHCCVFLLLTMGERKSSEPYSSTYQLNRLASCARTARATAGVPIFVPLFAPAILPSAILFSSALQRLIIAEVRPLPMTNATGVIMHGLSPLTKTATGLISDGKGLLMATPTGLITGAPIIGVQSRGVLRSSTRTDPHAGPNSDLILRKKLRVANRS